jgi:DNA-binding NarL/FixJ family response regulator
MTIRVLLIDDHPLVRVGVRKVIEATPDLEVVAEAADGASGLSKAQRYAPDVVVTDLLLPDVDGVELTRRIHEELPNTQVVVLTSLSEEDDALLRVVRAGAAGYVPKDSNVDLLLETIRSAGRGQAQLSTRAAARLFREMRKPIGHEFTDRELEVLRQLVLGQANKEIATSLAVAETTIKSHLCTIFGKLGVQSRTQAALKAMQLGLVSAST